jgi:hypothetical protein
MQFWYTPHALDYTLAFYDLELFARAHSRGAFDDAVTRVLPGGIPMGDFHVTFGEEFNESSFVFIEREPIPIIVPEECRRPDIKPNISVGDEVYLGVLIGRTNMRPGEWQFMEAVVVGTHNRNILMDGIPFTLEYMYSVLMPLGALEALQGEELRYINIDFEIDPVWNRELYMVEEELLYIANQSILLGSQINLMLHDEELREVVVPLEGNLSLLEMMYPVAIGLLMGIVLIVNMILMLQNAKNAAIMRVLGMTKRNSRLTLWLKNMITPLLGLVMGLLIVLVLSWGFGVVSTLGLMGLLFISSALGSVLGAVLITNRAPLDLLQVKE